MTRAATVVGPVNTLDTWTLVVAGTPVQVPAPGTTTAGVAGAFATATYPSGYTAFVIGSTVYVTGASTFTLSSTPVGRHATGNGTFSGTVPLIWTQTAVFSPAGTPAIQLGDLWSITVGMTTYTARVTDIGTSSGNYGFGLTGGTATSYTVANTTAASTALAGALATAIGAQASLAGGTTLTLTGTGGSPLGVGPLTEQRVGALPTASTADTNTHYENVTATLSGDVTPVWQPTETWTLTIDGHAYTFLVPGTGFTTAQQTLTTIAAQLVLAYNTSSTKDTNLQVTSSGGEILIKDNTTGGTDPFSFSITRGSSAVTGVIDIDNANDIASSVLVPVVLPEFQWLVALFPWAKQYFEVADSLGFTAQPEFQLWGPGSSGPNTLLATVTCTLIPNTNTCSLTPDAGSAQASDPFLEYNFTQTGTYTVKVGANVTWNGATTFLDVPNTFFSSGFQGVQTGMKYTLFISLEHHATNPNALSLVGKQITITAGAGAGQTATITAYDPQNGTYTLDQQWATAPDAGSRFQITESTASLPGYAPVTDSYKVVLTSPVPAGQTVYVDVSPQPTPTYNADEAFDPNSNYGQNNAVQVRVQTPRALFLLTGVPTPGETWTILLNDQPFSYRIQLGDTLATIAHQYTLMIGGVGTDYTASVDPSNADQVIVQSSTGASFYAGFQITHEAEGGATVTPSPSAGAALTFSGIPAPGEIWRLTLDGVVYSTLPATSSDTLATIMQALAVQLPAHGYTFTISGNVLNVARAAGTGQITASLAVTAPTVGNISLNYSFFNEADLLFGGTPVAGERWSVFVDGNQISTVSTAGESIAQVISSLAGQIPFIYPYDYSYSAGLSDLFVEHGFWLFFGYSSISLFGTVTLNPSQVYGTVAVANTAPTGVNIVLNAPSGGPAAGETWTLTVDGTKYSYAYTGGGSLSTIAQALANLIPQSPATAHGGPYYSVGVSGSSLVVRRSDQAVPVTASVSVSLPATASTVPNPSNPAQTTVTYTGSPLQGEVWAITVDGTTYSYVSNTGDPLSTVIGALKSAIPAAGYTVSQSGTTSQSLTITSKTVGATLDAFGSVVLDTSETQGTGTATASGQNVTIALPAIQVGAGETWALTVDGTPFAYTTTATDTPATIAAQLGILVHAVGTYNVIVNGTTLTLSRVDGNTTSASLAISTLGAAGGGAMGSSVAVDFEGQPTQGEVWTLSITTTSGTETHSFAVLYGDTLSDIASGLGKALSLDTYNVSVVGRVLTISLLHGGQLSAGIAISPDSLGGAVITQQLVFTSANWNVAQSVTVQALDNQFADGHDALVFPPMTGTLNQVLGPVIIDGGLSVNPEPFLNNPLMLPGETNLPLADGTIAASGANLAAGLTAAGLAFISDPNATSVTATTGQRPGFDPRMNDFAYTVEFLNGTASQETLDVSGTSHDILSVANITPFTFALTGGDYRFIGTPDQSMTEGSLHTSSLTFADATVQWNSATLTLAGSANVGDTWTLVLNGTSYTYTVVAGQTSPAAIASNLAALAAAAGFVATPSGAAIMLAASDGSAFSIGLVIVAPAGATVHGSASVTGAATKTTTQSMSAGTLDTSSLTFTGGSNIPWSQADVTLTGLPNVGDIWTLTLNGKQFSYTVAPGDDVASRVALELASLISSDYTVEPRVGILGDSELIITRSNDTNPFTVGFGIVAPAGKTVEGSASVTGTPTNPSALTYTMAAAQLLSTTSTANWSLTLNDGTAETVSFGATSTDVGTVTQGLARLISSDYGPLVTGTQVFFQTGWDVDPATGLPLTPQSGDQYYVAPLNLNTRVDESTQVDTLTVDDHNDPSNGVGTLTESSITGFGMGGPTVVAGQTIPGGITYSNIESVNLELGKGDNLLTVANTSDGSTNVTSGNGDNTIDVQSIVGQTSITTGTGADTINVDNSRSVLQLGGLLTIDTGGGNDTVNVDDSGVTVATDGTLTGSTLTGLAPLTVAEEQTIVVQAAGGTYTLLLPNALPGHGSIQLDYIHDNAATVQAALRTAYGTTDIDVTEVDASTTKTFTVTFGGAHAGQDFGQITWAGSWTLTTPATGSFTLTDPNYGVATLTGPVDATALTNALQAIYKTTEVTATATGTPNVFSVIFSGSHAGLDLSQLTGAGTGSVVAVTQLVPAPDASASVTATTVRDGTTSPVRDNVQTIDVGGATGSFVLHFVLPNSQGVLQDYETGSIPVTATAADLLAALSTVLNPNNVNPALPFTDNVAVEKHGTTFTITYQGSMKTQSIAYIDTSGITNGHVTVANRASGIDYYNVGTLNIDLGSGDDVFNVQGTTATTNLSTAAGDDRIYVSSGANVGLSDFPSFISGTLDNLHGTLNIDAGTGNQTLMISAEGSNVGDTNALITRSYATVHAASPTTTLTPTADLYLTGFAPAGISITAAATGNFGGGITIWTGSGPDHITVDATHFRAGVNEVTTLNSGLGNDNVTVNLTDGVDGAFVLDAQGPDENLLHLSTPVQTGDYNTPADTVGVSLDGSALTSDQFVVDASLDEVGVMVSPEPGTQAVVTLIKPTVTRFTLGASHTVSLGTALQNLGPNDTVSATVNGAAVDASQMTIDPLSGNVTFASTSALPVGALVLIEIIRQITQQFALPQATDPDNDVVDASGSTLPITVFGGQGDDTITAGVGGDVIFGDRGRILWFQPGTPAPTIPQDGLSVAQLAALESTAVAVAGGGGPANDAMTRLWGLAVTIDPSIGGSDTINVPAGNDVVFGGQGNDTINLGSGTNLVFGDSGYVDWAVSADGTQTEIANAASILPDVGGNDTITTGSGSNIVVGGAGSDTIQLAVGQPSSTGTNIVLGDNGSITTNPFSGPEFHSLPIVLASIQTTVDGVGGNDTITTGSGDQIVFGGPGSDKITTGSGSNIVFGDDGRLDWGSANGQPIVLDAISTDESDGAADTITMGSGPNIVIGGAGGDTISGGTDTNIVLGDSGAVYGVAGNPDPFGSLPITVGMVQTTAPGIGGDDTITVGSGSAIVMGGTGNDDITTGTNTSFIFGDDGYITWVGSIYNPENLTWPGQNTDPSDIDLVASTDPTDGGNDNITIGAGRAIVVGGGGADHITGGTGTNIILGDDGRIFSAGANTNPFGQLPITLGMVETTDPGFGGNDVIQTGTGSAIVMGGTGDDQISTVVTGQTSPDDTYFVFGDDGYITWVGAQLNPDNLSWAGANNDPTDIDLVASTDAWDGGNDTDHDRRGPRDRRRRPGQRHDHRRLRHRHRPRRRRRHLRRQRQPGSVRHAADDRRRGRDDESGCPVRRQRHDHDRHRQRHRDGRHRRRRHHHQHEHELRLRRRRLHHVGRGVRSAGPARPRREHRPGEHRSRRVHGSDGRRRRQHHRRLRPGDRRRRRRLRPHHGRHRRRTSSSATTAASSRRTPTRCRSASCRSPSRWSRRPIRRTAGSTRSRPARAARS